MEGQEAPVAQNATPAVSERIDTLGAVAIELLSIEQIAELLGVSRRTVERYVASAELGFPAPAATIGRVRGWRQRDVERWARKTLPIPMGRSPKRSQ
jgi:excisionase family DNA binding protein